MIWSYFTQLLNIDTNRMSQLYTFFRIRYNIHFSIRAPNIVVVVLPHLLPSGVNVPEVKNGINDESHGANHSNLLDGHPLGKQLASNNGHRGATSMANHSAENHRPEVGTSAHGNCADLRPVAPFGQKGHDEDLDPSRRQYQTGQVGKPVRNIG